MSATKVILTMLLLIATSAGMLMSLYPSGIAMVD